MSSCLIIAGEKSGEEHAMSFFPRLKSLCPETQFFGVGGDDLKLAGLELQYHLNDFSTWGYSEVFKKIPFYKEALKNILAEVEKRNCKTAILVDFQSFNMKLAKALKEKGVNVLYYVAPQAWAWKEYRVKALEKNVHTLFTIIPFEKQWFLDRGVKRVVSIDHPLLTHYENDLINKPIIHRENIKTINLLLLPGSRNFEVKNLLPLFVEAVDQLKKQYSLKVSVVKSSSVDPKIYASYDHKFDQTYWNEELTTALRENDICFAASGTVTLACALYEIPTIVTYKTSLLNEFIFHTFVPYKGPISLANIVHQNSVFPELVQDQVTPFNLVSCFREWAYNGLSNNKLKNL
ncbi:MAG: hypothetical protein L6Q33_05530, partial [Bacteriovoracaceae bacterium]|nr:hypothetical protein [Bacteriovoracaceae bacterium]